LSSHALRCLALSGGKKEKKNLETKKKGGRKKKRLCPPAPQGREPEARQTNKNPVEKEGEEGSLVNAPARRNEKTRGKREHGGTENHSIRGTVNTVRFPLRSVQEGGS